MRPWLLGVGALAAIGVIAFVGYVALGGPGSGPGGTTPWATLSTRDVHSLAFAPGDPSHLYFGHHTGLLESHDGGRSWQPTALSGADAMNVRPAGGSTIQVAGHNVYVESTDGGSHWNPVPNDLPGLDLHAFTLDPGDPKHAWAWSVGNGLFETTDQGRHWALRQSGDWPVLAAVAVDGKSLLLGISGRGLGRSVDGGQTWTALTGPGGQVASLDASTEGKLLYTGTTTGLKRSDDGGQTWRATAFSGRALTVAMAGAYTVALVDDSTRFFRSDDGGATFGPPR
ncbi:MAG: YCF48-related protein [Chloroflexota bacterium]|nr:YCF48-related protein [Chloroflexota bacterium]